MRLPKRKLIILYGGFWLIITLLMLWALHFVLLKGNFWLEILIAMNIGSFVLFGFDKIQSTYENSPRLPELFFHLVAAVGGSVGIIMGAQVFRHKTQKISFMWKIVVIFAVQIGMVTFAYWRWLGYN